MASSGLTGLWLAGVVFSFWLTGCGLVSFARVNVNDKLEPAQVAFIRPGTTTFQEVLTELGTPDELIGSDETLVITYHFLDLTYSRVNYGWALRFWTPITPDLITEGLRLGLDGFQVAFDSDWKVRQAEFVHSAGVRPGFRIWPF